MPGTSHSAEAFDRYIGRGKPFGPARVPVEAVDAITP